MVPIISITGSPDSGKTTLIESLLPVLRGRGYSVGVIKHTHHDVPLDTPGKDTGRFSAAGAAATALVTQEGMAIFKPASSELDLESVAGEHFNGLDLVLAEGFKTEDFPRIEVCAEPSGGLNESVSERVAVVSDHEIKTGLPVFKHSDVAPLADFIEKNWLTKGSRSEVLLWVDGKFVPLKPFVKAFVGQTIKGMLNALKGSKNAEKIRIKIGR